MTERFSGVLVTFDRDIRQDDVQAVLNAIRMIKGVLSVNPVVSDINQQFAEDRVRRELGQKLFDVIYPERKEGRLGG